MRNLFIICLYLMGLILPGLSSADTFEKAASYTVCFTPGQDCTSEIVNVINNAISNVWVQAYSFTSKPIAQALVLAKQRGVNVQIILDKSVLENNKNIVRLFNKQRIPMWIDNVPAIAHNKVIVIDQTQTITGSFNFTRAAQQQNAENVLIVYDEGLAKKYLANWQAREQAAQFYKGHRYATADASVQADWLTQFWQWLVNLFNQLYHFFR